LGSITKWRPNTKQPFGRFRQQWTNRIKEDLRMIVVENVEEVSKDKKK
jgi:hypothetical protein